jgi:uncharacterized membrane protein
MRQTPTLGSSRYSRARSVGLAIVFLWFLIGGLAHFALTEQEMRIVPPYIPWHRAAVLVSGVFELIGAAGLWWPTTRRAAGVLLFAVTIAVTPVHVWMLQTANAWPVPYWALVARLPLQAALLALILWTTWPRSGMRFYERA